MRNSSWYAHMARMFERGWVRLNSSFFCRNKIDKCIRHERYHLDSTCNLSFIEQTTTKKTQVYSTRDLDLWKQFLLIHFLLIFMEKVSKLPVKKKLHMNKNKKKMKSFEFLLERLYIAFHFSSIVLILKCAYTYKIVFILKCTMSFVEHIRY